MEIIYKKRLSFRVRTISKQNILFGEGGKAYNLNETGLLIWESIDGISDFSAILNKITETYGCTREKAKEDLEEFIKFLLNINSISVVSKAM
jgi:hypothetical protein